MATQTVRTLLIRLGEVHVGHLSRYSDGRSLFMFAEQYQLLGETRPTLSLYFTDPGSEDGTFQKLQEIYPRNNRLPSYFRNLLPEGALRDLMARKLGTTPDDEIAILEGLGKDLPGAVAADREETPSMILAKGRAHAGAIEEGKPQTLFSLGGAQLKFSLLKQGARFTVTRSSSAPYAGEWIVKPPHPTFSRVPENEYAMLTFAREIGIDAPDAELVKLKDLELGEDANLLAMRGETIAYAIRRFDRANEGIRVHTEDFAQVFGVDPEDEYRATNYDTIGNLIFNVFPDPYEQISEFVRRLAFMILIGNSDAHLKNWSIIYRDGRTPQLSPAYDLISTIQYVPSNRTLALNIRKERDFSKLSIDHFARMAKRVGIAPDFITDTVQDTVNKARAAWPTLARQISKELRQTLEQHTKTLKKDFRYI